MSPNQALSTWKSIQDYLGGCQWEFAVKQYGSLPTKASKGDVRRLAHGWTLTISVWYDLFSEAYFREYTIRSIWSWVKQLSTYSIDGAMDKLSSACLAIHEMDGIKTFKGFKHLCNDFGFDLDEPFFRLLRPVFKDLVETGDLVLYKKLNTALCFIGRLTLQDLPIEEQVDKWHATEERLRTQPLDAVSLKCVKSILQDVHVTPKGFRHSSGANAYVSSKKRLYGVKHNVLTKGATATLKWRYFVMDAMLRQECLRTGLQDLAFFREGMVKETSRPNVSVLMPVPKKATAKRFICIEPVGQQWFQHGVANGFVAVLDEPQWCVRLTDQEVNRRYCRNASKFRNFATVDLSEASDSISLRLAKEILPLQVLGHVMRTRSGYTVLPTGEQVKLEKLCSMGNAWSFPLECLIFSAACRVATGDEQGRFTVYGDDIIIHVSAYERLIEILNGLGFLVNDDKTYPPYHAFKESCGVEYFNGFDVTPVRIPRRMDITKLRKSKNPKYVSGLAQAECFGDLANKLYSEGCYCARAYLLRTLKEAEIDLLFSTWPSEVGIWSETPTNYQLQEAYHRDEKRGTSFQATGYMMDQIGTSFSGSNDKFGLYSSLEALELRDHSAIKPEDQLQKAKFLRTRSVKRRRWVPEPR